MAKSKKVENVNMATDGQYPSEVRHGKDFSISTEHPGFASGLEQTAGSLGMSPKGLFYLIQYGYTQSMQDSIAGMAKKLGGETDESGERKHSDAQVAVAIHDALKERHDAIVAGDVGTRSTGPRVQGVDKIMQDYAWEVIVKAAANAGKSAALPKDTTGRRGLVEKYLADETRRDTARAEAERRMSAAQASVDLGDLI